ncbi:hypothetical protein MAR_010965 [Mya arenaria]|uniref:Uncharacterized protein n=1 Tax=Mya arenaria TaxID=6604 RepID=A0ABY7FWP4_MYAAR|nr:uncharacterized protein LOC128216591 [Mya arenaria]WAR25261.1 hypothetical protein MAR_010965 [Mya arenaria]
MLNISMMAGGNDGTGREGEAYAARLQLLMKECLPPILVEIVELRPRDPIHHLAHCLYRFGEKHAKDQLNGVERNNHGNKSKYASHRSNDTAPSRVQIVEDCERTSVPQELHLGPSKAYLHGECIVILRDSEDLFDDDDLS